MVSAGARQPIMGAWRGAEDVGPEDAGPMISNLKDQHAVQLASTSPKISNNALKRSTTIFGAQELSTIAFQPTLTICAADARLSGSHQEC